MQTRIAALFQFLLLTVAAVASLQFGESMIDSIMPFGLIAVGSLVWLVLQIISWTPLIRLDNEDRLRRLMKWTPIVAPVIVLVLLALAKLAGSKVGTVEWVLVPLAASWVFCLSFAGLRIAASRLSGSNSRSKR